MLGMLIARLLSGILTNYTSWRTIYYLAFGLQYLICALLFFFLPDYPSTNPEGITYVRILYSIGQHLFTYPTLVQACLIGLVTGAIFTNFWTTLTFLLASEPYNLSPIMIGLYSLIGLLGILAGPPISRVLIDRYTTLFSVFIGLTTILLGVCIGTYTGTITLAGSVIQSIVMDIGITTAQIANRSAIYAIAPKARNRVNTAYMVALFCGQLMGTAMGNRLYAEGGWIASGSASVGFGCVGLLIAAAKGPWTDKWVGWKGGFSIRRRDLGPPVVRVEGAGGGTGGEGADVEKAGDGKGRVDGGDERGGREAESKRGRMEKEDGKLPSHIQGR
jgi:predicted MFS family arabinose efflux permease